VSAGALADAARLTVGAVLVASGVAKVVTRRGSELELGGLGVPATMAPGAALAIPLLELALAALVLAVPARWPVWLAVAAFALFTGVVVAELQRGVTAPCRCFGSLSNRPMSTRALMRNAWFLALAVVATGASGLGGVGWLAAPLLAVSAALILTS
jgi:methylamine utilization protein MauE